MSAPKEKVRRSTYKRDNHRCVASSMECFGRAEWNHRESSGHGGRGSKALPVTEADGVTTCASHNQRFERDLYDLALRMGWKLKRNRRMSAADLPYFDNSDRAWYLPMDLERANPINANTAEELLSAAGNFRKLVF